MPNSCRLLGLADGVTNPTEGLAMRQGLTNAIDLQMALAWFVLGGICERHPALHVAFLEGTGGWMVPMLERFDHQFKIFGSSDQKTLPSELFARQCVVSFDPDEAALPFTVEHLGAERVLWASDYPHPDAKIPGVVKELLDALAPLPQRGTAHRRRGQRPLLLPPLKGVAAPGDVGTGTRFLAEESVKLADGSGMDVTADSVVVMCDTPTTFSWIANLCRTGFAECSGGSTYPEGDGQRRARGRARFWRPAGRDAQGTP